MYKFVVVFFALLFVFVGIIYPTTLTYAQDFTFEKAYQDYIFTQSKYSQSYNSYQIAKDNYQKNQTLSLKEVAREKTYQMLTDRESLLTVYITAVKMRVFENKGLSSEIKTDLIKKIDNEIAWLDQHKNKYKSDDNIEDLFNKSKETEARYKTNILTAVYEGLFYITYGDLMHTKISNLDVYTNLKKYIEKGVLENKFRIDPFNRWFLDIENINKEITLNEVKAKEKIQKMYTESYNAPSSAFNSSITILEANLQKLSQLNEFTFELLNAIRLQTKISK